jgi:hypothetical protein
LYFFVFFLYFFISYYLGAMSSYIFYTLYYIQKKKKKLLLFMLVFWIAWSFKSTKFIEKNKKYSIISLETLFRKYSMFSTLKSQPYSYLYDLELNNLKINFSCEMFFLIIMFFGYIFFQIRIVTIFYIHTTLSFQKN